MVSNYYARAERYARTHLAEHGVLDQTEADAGPELERTP